MGRREAHHVNETGLHFIQEFFLYSMESVNIFILFQRIIYRTVLIHSLYNIKDVTCKYLKWNIISLNQKMIFSEILITKIKQICSNTVGLVLYKYLPLNSGKKTEMLNIK